MGLADRLKAYEAEQAAQKAAEAEAVRKAIQEAQRMKLQDSLAYQEGLALEQAKEDTLKIQLSHLLDLLEARGQLEGVRKFWGAGEIDPQPQLVSRPSHKNGGYYIDKYFTGFGLALRQTYLDINKVDWEYYDGGSKHLQTTIGQTSTALQIYVSFNLRDEPAVTTIYESKDGFANSSTYPKNISGGNTWSPKVPTVHHSILFERVDTIDPRNPISSRETLENQLVELVTHPTRYPSPLEIQRQARERIMADQYIPQHIKNRGIRDVSNTP